MDHEVPPAEKKKSNAPTHFLTKGRVQPSSTVRLPLSRVTSLPTSCQIWFGAPAAGLEIFGGEPALRVALPVLAGANRQEVLPAAGEAMPGEGCTCFRADGRLAGFAVAPAGLTPEDAAREVYDRLLTATRGHTLYRIWNYVPQINAVSGGLEHYRQFCRGRSVAFENHFGAGFQLQLPAASGVGSVAGPLAVAFLAGTAPARHIENPRQVPAFAYPARYGPRAPSFCRATVVVRDDDREIFISGTAAIRGHESVASTDLAGQLACTRENLELIARAAGAGSRMGAEAKARRIFHAYIRHAEDFGTVRADLERHLLRPGDAITYLQADLCRAELQVEIEAVLRVPHS